MKWWEQGRSMSIRLCHVHLVLFIHNRGRDKRYSANIGEDTVSGQRYAGVSKRKAFFQQHVIAGNDVLQISEL